MNMTKTAMIAVLGSTALAGAAQAEDGFRFYGFLNPAMTSIDDGSDSYNEFGDNSNAPSRIGAWYEMSTGNGTLKFNFETALGFNGSAAFSQGVDVDAFDWDKTDLRKIEAIYVTDTAGTFYVGQGSMAADGIAGGTDMSGTDLVGTVAVADTAGGYQFRTSAGALSGIKVADIYKDFDAARRTRVRYDTPSFAGGFVVSAAAGMETLKDGVDDNYYDIALRYTTDTGAVKVKAMASYAYTDVSGGSNFDAVVGSAGFLHKDSGVSGTVTIGDQSNSGQYIYGKVGFQQDWFAAGKTYLSVDAFKSEDMATAGDEGTTFGFEAVQKIDSANMEVYFGYHQHGYNDLTGTIYNDVDAYMLGARWSF